MAKRRRLIPIAMLGVAIAAVIATARADEMHMARGDATPRFLALGVSTSTVVDFTTDLKEVLVSDPSIVKAVPLTRRQIHIIAAALGQSNVFFYAVDGRQIGALSVAVLLSPPESGEFPPNVVNVFFGPPVSQLGGGGFQGGGVLVSFNCGPWPYKCIDPRKPGADQAPGTQNINITGNAAGAATVPVGR